MTIVSRVSAIQTQIRTDRRRSLGIIEAQCHRPVLWKLGARSQSGPIERCGADRQGVRRAGGPFLGRDKLGLGRLGVGTGKQVLGQGDGVAVYDDFAHHPTAIRTTLEGLRARVGGARIVVALEPRSNSMRLGAHADALAPSLDSADEVVFLHRPELPWGAGRVVAAVRGQARTVPDTDTLLAVLRERVRAGDHVVFMSNGGFDGAPRRFAAMLAD